MELNEIQKKVVYTNEPFLFLLAGAGSGKTRVVIERIKYLLKEGVEVKAILALTFTNKAANEMKERIGNSEIAIHTFHQYCFQQLKKTKRYDYDIYQEREQDFSKEIMLEISKYKNSYFKTKKPKYFERYQSYLKSNNLKDFEDLLIDFLEENLKSKNRRHYDYIFIDEFQDTNELQYMILKTLIDDTTNVLCVGDPDQSIYAFRGAKTQIINQFIKEYKAKVEKLMINYRSNSTIINHANRLIKRNYRKLKKDLIPFHSKTNQITSYLFMDTEEESKTILEIIKEHISKGVKPLEIAVLYRSHYRSFHLINYLKKEDYLYYQIKDKQTDHIHMLTIHQAKGLEFEVVIILGLEASIFPSLQTNQKQLLEEERRLMFVAMTRAKNHLIFTHICYDSFFQRQKPSLFIKESGVKSKIYRP